MKDDTIPPMEYFTTSQFMDQVGVKFSTLRHYERIGLLSPVKGQRE